MKVVDLNAIVLMTTSVEKVNVLVDVIRQLLHITGEGQHVKQVNIEM